MISRLLADALDSTTHIPSPLIGGEASPEQSEGTNVRVTIGVVGRGRRGFWKRVIARHSGAEAISSPSMRED